MTFPEERFSECMPQQKIQQRTADEIVVPEAQIQEHIVQVGKVIPQERSSERIVEQIGDIFVHQIVGEIVPVVHSGGHSPLHLWSRLSTFP